MLEMYSRLFEMSSILYEKGGESMSNYIVGFVTEKGLMLDLDNINQKKARKIAQITCKKHKLKGYLLVKSSRNHYHIIFNRTNISWRKTLQIIFSLHKCVFWGIQQARKGWLTLRISQKKGKIPKIIEAKGNTDKLINLYLYHYYLFKEMETNR